MSPGQMFHRQMSPWQMLPGLHFVSFKSMTEITTHTTVPSGRLRGGLSILLFLLCPGRNKVNLIQAGTWTRAGVS